MRSYSPRPREIRKIQKIKVFHAVGFFDLMMECRNRYFPFEARAIYDPINEQGRNDHVSNQVMESLWNELELGNWDAYLKEHPLPRNPYKEPI